MLHKTRAIVLKTTKYSESSIIAKVFTEKFGIQSYMIKGARRPGSKAKANILQPLYLLEMIVYHQDSKELQQVKEIKNTPVFHSIPFHVMKSSIAIFINEIIYRSLKHEESDPKLFEFLFSSVCILDSMDENFFNLHLVFLMQYSKYLGFYPQLESMKEDSYFDLLRGVFVDAKPHHPQYLNPEQGKKLYMLMNISMEDSGMIPLSAADRRALLNKLIEYYSCHIENFGDIRSHKVLEDVLN